MRTERVTRARSVEYRISFIQKKREIYVYIGSTWAGRIIKCTEDYGQKQPHFGGFLQLPGLWGPVCRVATVHEAKIGVSSAIREWLGTFNGTPVDVEERAEREVQGRVTRTRTAPKPPALEGPRVTRTRIRS